MVIYVLKLSVCLLVFWGLYVLLLEKQSTHQFKRYYLLGTLLTSATIPLMSITTYIDPLPIAETVSSLYVEPDIDLTEPEPAALITFSTLLWTLYFLGLGFFGLRFFINLSRLIKKIRSHERLKTGPFIYVLLQQALPPHSFFNYLFFYKQDYNAQRIPREVLIHEQTHAKQLHSLDILLLELLQVALWFNPLIYLMKHHIKLNHEFLADRAVLNQGVSTKTYQNILLDYLSHPQNFQLSSSINYSSARLALFSKKLAFGQVKKRIHVMKTTTSRTRSTLVHLLVIPVVSLLFFSFAERKTEFSQVPQENEHKTKALNQAVIYVRADSMMRRHNQISYKPKKLLRDARQLQNQGFESPIYVENPEDREDLMRSAIGMVSGINPNEEISTSTKIISVLINPKQQFLINNIKGDYTSFLAMIKSINLKTNVLIDLRYDEETPSDFINNVKSIIKKNGIKFTTNQNYFEELPLQQGLSVQDSVDSYLRVYNTYQKLKAIPPHYKDKSLEDQNKLDALYSVLGSLYFKLSKENKAKVKRPVSPIYPYVKITLNGKSYYKKRDELTAEEKATLPPPPPPALKNSDSQKGATEEQLAEYNTWAKGLNKKSSVVKFKDYEYFNAIYKHMTKSQKETAEPFPAFPPPPKPYDGYLKDYNAWAGKLAEEMRKAESDKQYPYPIIKQSDIYKYRNIYNNKLSDEERKLALPFPKIPPPPPPPPASKDPTIKNYQEVKPPPPPPPQPYAKTLENGIAVSTNATKQAVASSDADGKTYAIKNIVVSGTTKFNPNTIIAFSQLQKGDDVIVGGEKLSNAAARLWRSDLFKSIEIYLINKEGDETDIEIHVVDRPKEE